jgi:predicted outer membrane lipoprotein
MKPILTSPERLMLRSRPWLLGIGLICAMLILAAVALNKFTTANPDEGSVVLVLFAFFAMVFAVFVRQEVVILDRAANAVVIRSATVIGAREVRHALSDVSRASTELDTDSGGESRGKLRRPVLLLTGGEKVPLTPIFATGGGAEAAAQAINRWLNPRKT